MLKDNVPPEKIAEELKVPLEKVMIFKSLLEGLIKPLP